MISALLISAQAPAAPSASELLSRMLARYNAATSAQGTIATVQAAQGVKVNTRTRFAFQKPRRLLIEQARDGSEGGKWRVVSDGVRFSYDRPKGTFGPDRYTEEVGSLDVKGVYVSIKYSIGERSPVLDAILGQTGDLKELISTIFQPSVEGEGKVGETPVTWIRAGYNPDRAAKPVGELRIALNKNDEIVRWAQSERVLVSGSQEVVVETVYDVDIALNRDVAGGTFKL
jgi:hypothetical protein